MALSLRDHARVSGLIVSLVSGAHVLARLTTPLT